MERTRATLTVVFQGAGPDELSQEEVRRVLIRLLERGREVHITASAPRRCRYRPLT